MGRHQDTELERISGLSNSPRIKHLNCLENAFSLSSLLNQSVSAAAILSALRNAQG